VLCRAGPAALLALVLVPLAAGLAATVRMAAEPGAWAALAGWPGLTRAMALSVGTGVVSTLIALGVVLLILATLTGTRAFAVVLRLLSPLLALPHAAAAMGLAFLIAPSGWIARLVSPWATGWQVPPDLLILGDPLGLALTAGLVAKEVPFLLLMALAGLAQADPLRRRLVAESLGRGRAMAFAVAVLPGLWPALRLPVAAVAAYGMTAVDMALILGPARPPPLSVQVVLWMGQADLAARGVAAAGALVQLGLVAAVLACGAAAERAGRAGLVGLAVQGARGAGLDRPGRWVALALAGLVVGGLAAGLGGLALWSVAGPWRFPDALPEGLTLAPWTRAGAGIAATAGTTLGLALAVTLPVLALVLLALQTGGAPGRGAQAVLFAPLLVPQVAVLPGLAELVLRAGLGAGPLAVGLGHAVMVAPYVMLSLAGPWQARDLRVELAAQALGAGPARIFWRLRLPMLLRPVLTALAVGLAVSIGQYLPTLVLGGGRVATLTTEAVALASGGDRRLAGALALAQAGAAAAGFALALAVPALAFARRRGMAAHD
jgi:putative thiamine transport system permease protein